MLEIEFLIAKNGEVLPEVKPAILRDCIIYFIQENEPDIAFKLVDGNVGFTDSKFTIPHYIHSTVYIIQGLLQFQPK